MTPFKVLTVALALAALPAPAATVVYSFDHFAKDGSNMEIIHVSEKIGNITYISTYGGTAFSGYQGGDVSATNPYPGIKNFQGLGLEFIPSNVGSGAAGGTFYFGTSNHDVRGSGVSYDINSAGTTRGNGSGVSPTAASNLFGITYDAIHTSSAEVPMAITLTGLTLGVTYEFQAIFSAANDRLLYLPGNTPPSEHPDGGLSNGTADLAYGPTSGPGLLTALFVADSATQTFTFSNIDQADEQVNLSAIFLNAVPEASSSALLLLGAAAGLTRRRR